MVTEIIHSLKRKNYKGILRCVKSVLPPKFTGNLVFKKNYHRPINYNDPTLLDEKLLILRGTKYYKNDLITKCADKYEVRDYITQKGQKNILNSLIGVYSSANEIKWEELPEKFVIKCNHGSGYNIIVTDKSSIYIKEVEKQLNYWMKENYGIISSELQYKNIKPLILIETFLETQGDSLPVDYKFFASKGNVICCLLVTGRGVKQERIFVDKSFNDLKLVNEYTGDDYSSLKPSCYDEMIEIASTLSNDFPFVRVDLYDVNGKVIFGELTFTPHGCIHEYLSQSSQEWLGSKIKL